MFDGIGREVTSMYVAKDPVSEVGLSATVGKEKLSIKARGGSASNVKC